MLRRRFLQGAAASALLLPETANAFLRGGFAGSSGAVTPTWNSLPVGGGGYMRGIDIVGNPASGGVALVRSDTSPALWTWSQAQNKWLPLVTAYSMPALYVGDPFGTHAVSGVWAARICPSLTTKFYMVYGLGGNTEVPLVSTNSGATWTVISTGFPAITDADPNSNTSNTNYTMAVDPANDAVCYIGTPSAGLQKTVNSGASWATDTGVTASTSQGIAIAFDPTSAVTGGKTQGIFACSNGQGVWHTSNGGTTWTKLSSVGMPTTFYQMIVDQNGKLWISDSTNIKTIVSPYTTWVTNSLTDNPGPIAVDPNNALNVAASSSQGRTYLSIDGGTTWTSPEITTTVTTTGDATWTAWGPVQGFVTPGYTPPPAFGYSPGSYGISMGAFAFDSASKLYVSHGFGIWQASSPFANWNSSITWASFSRGTEALDGNCIIHPPGGNPVGGAWDLPIWNFTTYISSPAAFPASYGPTTDFNGPMPNYGVNGVRTWCLDYASGTTSFLTAITGVGAFSSSDSGATWTFMPSTGGTNPFTNIANGGCIASSTTTNHVVMCASTAPSFTTDNGVTWTPCTYAGAGFSNFPFDNSVFVCADRVTANKFYMYSVSDGFYSSTNSGATFAKVSAFNVSAGLSRLKAVPGNAGHVFWAPGISENPMPQTADQLFWSTNSAVTWSSALADFNSIMDFGFGTIVSGQTYPTIYLAAYRISTTVLGVYRCNNFNPATGAGTWTLMANSDGTPLPNGWLSAICGLAGDPAIDNRCSIAFFNGGFMRYA